ncbi:hypothetical protein Anas_09657 [Armadillidium nasatum]|uniref:Uncharacterized protein n=1 Tax=Armadillidium nasatum TaxID=96803 RepID=A0A5N5SK16_9CRUS|nr:hypothetical protein Anas_09657 [Armadillidium nasatum]
MLITDEEGCYQEFSMVFQSATEISFEEDYNIYCYLVVSFIETIPVGSNLYSISWSDDLVKPPYVNNTKNPDTALEYIEYNTNNNEKIMSFYVLNSMEGLMDYDNSQEETVLSLLLYFSISANETYYLRILHRLVDISAWDHDHLAPNNQFEVITNDDCPLKSDTTYTSLQGLPVNVSFELKRKLDYDTMSEPYQIKCTIYLEE